MVVFDGGLYQLIIIPLLISGSFFFVFFVHYSLNS